MPKLVYLEAQGNGTFRSNLRSDTLWGILCWTISMLQDASPAQTDDVGLLVKDYLKEEQDRKHAFYLSSAFPWVEIDGKRTHFLPAPLVQPSLAEDADIRKATTVQEKKAAARKHKKQQAQRKGFISWEEFDFRYGAGNESDVDKFWQPKLESQAVTHNQIDRSRLGTITENNAGQLFHMNENYLDWQEARKKELDVDRHGFYFLLEGNTDKVIPALRLIETMGIAGDKSIGKGHFKIDVVDDAHQLSNGFSLPTISDTDANASLCLSLFNPESNIKELLPYEAATAGGNGRLWQYKLEDRQGRNVYHNDLLQDGRLLFSEGSIFPALSNGKPYPGQNWAAGTHRLGHTIYRYGHAFMLNMKIK